MINHYIMGLGAAWGVKPPKSRKQTDPKGRSQEELLKLYQDVYGPDWPDEWARRPQRHR